MGDEAVSGGSYLVVSEKKTDNSSSIVLGASCALFALRLLLEPNINDEKCLEFRNRILDGSAQLLGLLVWSIRKEESNRVKCEFLDKLESAEREIAELKSRRSEDAKANEKVVNIFSTHEQSWFIVRKKLQQQVRALLNELKNIEENKEEVITELNEQLQEKELLLQSKEESLKEQLQKNLDLEGKLKEANSVADELREAAKNVFEEHSTEIWKHKTACIELVSTQRQLEADMGRAVRQVEAAEQDLDSVLEQKEQSVSMTQKLSMELVRMRKDLEQKDTILSAMLRKSKLDTEEKQMLLKEVKLSKTRIKQAELETERWRTVSESKHERHSLRSMLSKHAKSKLEASLSGMGMPTNMTTATQLGRTRSVETELIEYEQSGLQDEHKYSSSSEKFKTSGTEELDFKQMEGWVRFEAEKYATAFEQRHHTEIDAFAEQMRLKDEKLESCHWRSLSMELELKRLQTHIEALNLELSHLRQENLQLEALFLNREAELQSLKESSLLHFKHPNIKRSNSSSSSYDLAITGDTIWSKVKIVKSRPGDKEHDTTSSPEAEVETKIEAEAQLKVHSKDIVLMAPSPEQDCQEEKVVILDPSSIQGSHNSAEMVIYDQRLMSDRHLLSKKNENNSWKMDLNALGVSFKIKRIKQQLLMLERLTGKEENHEDREDKDCGHSRTKGVLMLISFLNKQVSRYLSLQGKIDDLCKRMHENDIYATTGSTGIARKKEETKKLEHFLEDTFQLQRYIVATGQKSTEIQSKITSVFVGPIEHAEGHASIIDMQRFSESLITLFKDVQRGLEVRISRIIGDLEGTLACEGMIHPRK